MAEREQVLDGAVQLFEEGDIFRLESELRCSDEIVELRDSQTGEMLARAADRRDPTRDTSMSLAHVSPTYMRADTRRLFRHWANLLRERLDAFRVM